MRVIEVIASLDIGGAERALAQRLRYQPDFYQTTIVHGPSQSPLQVELPERVETISMPLSRRTLATTIEQLSPDLVVVHNPANVIRLGSVGFRRPPPAMVYVSHAGILSEARWKRAILRSGFRRMLKRFDGCIAVSEGAQKPIGKSCPSVICQLGSELRQAMTQDPQPFDWPAGSRVRLTVLSRLTKTKNLDLFLKAVGALKAEFLARKACVLIVGTGPELQRLEKLANEEDLCEIVQFTGPTDSPESYLWKSDYVVITSRSEGGPLTAFEALLAGGRVVSTPVGVVPELAKMFPERILLTAGHRRSDIERSLQLALESGPVGDAERHRFAEQARSLHVSSRTSEFYSVLSGLLEPQKPFGRSATEGEVRK